MRTKISIRGGKIHLGQESIDNMFHHASDGDYILSMYPLSKPKTLEEWRKLYFFLRDILFEDGETGYTREELHDLVKDDIIRSLPGDCFLGGVPIASTANLSHDGWQVLIKRFKEWAFEKFNCYL